MRHSIIEQIIRTASCLKRPTTISIAFMRAAGIPARMPVYPGIAYPVERIEDAMIVECFSNHGSPMNLVL